MLDEAHNIEDVCRDSASIQSQEEGLEIWFYIDLFITEIKIQWEIFEFWAHIYSNLGSERFFVFFFSFLKTFLYNNNDKTKAR